LLLAARLRRYGFSPAMRESFMPHRGRFYGIGAFEQLTFGRSLRVGMRTRGHDFSFFFFSLFGFILDSPSIIFLFLISSRLLTYVCPHLYVCSDHFFLNLDGTFGARLDGWMGRRRH
jgi:hypothetical protein